MDRSSDSLAASLALQKIDITFGMVWDNNYYTLCQFAEDIKVSHYWVPRHSGIIEILENLARNGSICAQPKLLIKMEFVGFIPSVSKFHFRSELSKITLCPPEWPKCETFPGCLAQAKIDTAQRNPGWEFCTKARYYYKKIFKHDISLLYYIFIFFYYTASKSDGSKVAKRGTRNSYQFTEHKDYYNKRNCGSQAALLITGSNRKRLRFLSL